MTLFSSFLLALFTTVALVPIFRRLAYALQVVDLPAERKIHQRPMARTGGLAMAVGFAVSSFLWAPRTPFFSALMLALLVIVGAGFYDDLQNLGPLVKFGAQILAALVVVCWGGVRIVHLGFLLPEGRLLAAWAAIPLTVFVLVGVTNAINLADGLDGLAGGVSVLSFVLIGVLAWQQGDWQLLVMITAMLGSLFGFLRYNTFPATIFMGDAGSQMLGFVLGVTALKVTQINPLLSPYLPILLIGFPLLDTLTVMLERIHHGVSPFRADKNHFHHRLMRFGFRHSESVLMIYWLQSLMIGLAFWQRYAGDAMVLGSYLSISIAILLSFYILGRCGWRLRRLPEKGSLEAREMQVLLESTYRWHQLIKFLFRGLHLCLAGVLLLLVFSSGHMPESVGLLAGAGLLLLLVTITWRPTWCEPVMRGLFYLLVPAMVYQAELGLRDSGSLPLDQAHWFLLISLGFCTMVVFALLVLRFTRRDGYRSTPLDFLILVVGIMVPAVIPREMCGVVVGVVVVKILALFFVFEVIIAESRPPNRCLEAILGGILLLVGGKSFLAGH
jgi:UDP-GlcNAc:undecaprenyl-phosphate GlcNAc-1-phosphate transferase